MEETVMSSSVRNLLLAVGAMLLVCSGSMASPCAIGQLRAEILTISQEQFKVTFKITNQGTEGACVLKWNTMLDETFWPATTALFLGENLQTYASPVIPLRQSIQDADYAFIGRGTAAAVTVTRDLSQIFSFEKNRRYFLQIETRPQDCYTALRDTDCVARPAASQTPLRHHSPEQATQDAHFVAKVGKAASAQSFSEWLKINTPQQQNIDSTLVAFGNKNDVTPLFNTLIVAHNDAHTYLELGSDYLQPYQQSHVPMYEKWFGTYSESNYNYVRNNMRETYEETNSPHVYNFLPASMCKESWLAHVDTVLLGKKQHIINLCSAFFSPTLTASDRAVTLVREMARDTAATQDKMIRGVDCYGATQCKELAKRSPTLAIECAKSYALFSYDVYLATKSLSPTHNRRRITSSEAIARSRSGEAVRVLYRLLHLLQQ